MKILVDSYNTCTQNKSGGVQVRINKIVELLRRAGMQVDYFDKFNTKVKEYDILHIFMLTHENYSLIKYAKSIGVKVVISTIIPLNNGMKIDMYRKLKNIPIPTTYKLMIETMQLANAIITETIAEKNFIIKHYKVDKNKIWVIPNGMEESIIKTDDIYKYIEKDRKYILQVGRFDENKNQINVIKALRNTELDIVFIGGPQLDNASYYEKCKKEAGKSKNIHFLGWISQDSNVLKSAYSNAEMVILPSYSETFGITALEAIAAQKKIVLSNTLPILDYDIVEKDSTFNPSNIKEIKETVFKNYKREGSNIKYENVKKFFKWKEIINKHIQCYKELIGEKYIKKDL